MTREPRFPARPLLLALTVWLLVQAGTGWLLAVYFRPTPEEALASLYEVQYLVRGGAFVRAVHHYGASVLVAAVFAYVIAGLWQGGYARVHRRGWWSALAAAGAVLGLGFTGYLLPWDDRSYWAVRVTTELFGLVPLVGETVLRLLRGGPVYGASTLRRFYVLHTMVLPVAAAGALAWHWHASRRRRTGGEAVPTAGGQTA